MWSIEGQIGFHCDLVVHWGIPCWGEKSVLVLELVALHTSAHEVGPDVAAVATFAPHGVEVVGVTAAVDAAHVAAVVDAAVDAVAAAVAVVDAGTVAVAAEDVADEGGSESCGEEEHREETGEGVAAAEVHGGTAAVQVETGGDAGLGGGWAGVGAGWGAGRGLSGGGGEGVGQGEHGGDSGVHLGGQVGLLPLAVAAQGDGHPEDEVGVHYEDSGDGEEGELAHAGHYCQLSQQKRGLRVF